jgi:hypothetical protein
MSGNLKGIMAGSLIISIALVVCAVIISMSLKDLQKTAFGFLETQKDAAKSYVASQKCDLKKVLGMQKHEFKKVARRREEKLRNLIREELRNANIDIRTQSGQ